MDFPMYGGVHGCPIFFCATNPLSFTCETVLSGSMNLIGVFFARLVVSIWDAIGRSQHVMSAEVSHNSRSKSLQLQAVRK